MLWLKNHMPSSLFQNCMFFDLPDWLSYRATEDLARSNCSLACKCSYVPPGVEGSKGWNDEFFTEIGLEEFVRCLEGPLRSPLIFPRLMSRSFPNNVGQERFRSSRRYPRKERIDFDCWTTCRKGSFCESSKGTRSQRRNCCWIRCHRCVRPPSRTIALSCIELIGRKWETVVTLDGSELSLLLWKDKILLNSPTLDTDWPPSLVLRLVTSFNLKIQFSYPEFGVLTSMLSSLDVRDSLRPINNMSY